MILSGYSVKIRPSLSNSFVVIRSMMKIMFFILLEVSSSPICDVIPGIPGMGIIRAMFASDPILVKLFIWVWKSRNANLPSLKFFHGLLVGLVVLKIQQLHMLDQRLDVADSKKF